MNIKYYMLKVATSYGNKWNVFFGKNHCENRLLRFETPWGTLALIFSHGDSDYIRELSPEEKRRLDSSKYKINKK